MDASTLGAGIDPYRDQGDMVDTLAWLYADGLMGLDDRGMLRPALAASFPESRDGGRTWRYALASHVWHDGTPVRPSDVVDALATLRTTIWHERTPFNNVEAVNVIGERAFDVRLHAADRAFGTRFFTPLGTHPLPLLRSSDLPIGTGPFRVLTRAVDGRFELGAFDRSPRGRPAVDAITLRLVSNQTTTQVQLVSGEADIAWPLARSAPAADRYRFVPIPSPFFVVLLMNASGTLRDADLRAAVARIANTDVLRAAWEREAIPSPVPAAPLHALRQPLRLAYVAESPRHAALALVVQQRLAAAGIPVELHPRPTIAYEATNGPLWSGNFDLAIYRLEWTQAPDLGAEWRCDALPPHGANFARACDPELDRAIASAKPAEALRVLVDRHYVVPIARGREYLGLGRRIARGPSPQAGVPPTYDCNLWQLSG